MKNKPLLLLCLLFFPTLILAESSTSSSMTLTPPSTDLSVSFLENIFGVVDGVLHGTGSQIMGAIFNVFNSGILVLGGIVIMYIIVVATMMTAHEGQMLGQKFSSIWIPLRSTIGLSLLIPKASGYCMMQVFVMWTVVQGVGLADKVWAEALDYLNKGGVIISANMDSSAVLTSDYSKIASGAATIMYGQVCMLATQTQLEAVRDSYLTNKDAGTGPCMAPAEGSTMQLFCDTPVPNFIDSVNATTYYNLNSPASSYTLPMPYLVDASPPYDKLTGLCGSINWDALDTTSLGSMDSLSEQDIESVSSSRAMAVQQMYSTYTTATRTMVNNDPQITPDTNTSPSDYAASFAIYQFGVPYKTDSPCQTTGDDCPYWRANEGITTTGRYILTGTEYQDGIADYNGVMSSTVNLLNDAETSGAADDERAFITTANEQGWILAGTYFYDLIQLNGNAASSTSDTDTNTGLEKSAFDIKALTSPFNGGSCDTNDEHVSLCEMFNKDSSYMTAVATLFDGSPTYTTAQLDLSTTNPKVEDPTKMAPQSTCTVYGYVNDAYLMDLPDQPGLSGPTLQKLPAPEYFEMNYGPKEQSIGSTCSGLGWSGMKWCAGDMLKLLYNLFFVWPIQAFFDAMEGMANALFYFLIYLPLNAMCVIFDQGVTIIAQEGVNPIVALGTMGMMYIDFSMNFFFGLAFISVPASIFPAFWALMTVCMPIYASWLTVMIGIGFSTTYIIPFLPYMMFTLGAVGWFMAVIEAMVAAPVVALGIAHPEGHDALGKGEQGFMILLNVFLRPALMIIGYIMAISLTYVGVWLINAGYQHVLDYLSSSSFWGKDSEYGNWSAVFGYFFGAVTYTTLYMTLTEKAFSLIASTPDEVLTYIGGHASNKGKETAQWAEQAKGKLEKAGEGVQSGGIQSARKAGGATAKAIKTGAEMAGKAASGGGGGAGGATPT